MPRKRKKKNELKIYFAARITVENYIFLETIAKELGINKSEALRKILNFIMQLDPEKVKKRLDELKL